jgi:hypothetical protein
MFVITENIMKRPIFGVFENQVLGRMHWLKQATENCKQGKIRNISSSPRSITWAEIITIWKTGENVQFQQQNLKEDSISVT